jgi:hypothetical protein
MTVELSLSLVFIIFFFGDMFVDPTATAVAGGITANSASSRSHYSLVV